MKDEQYQRVLELKGRAEADRILRLFKSFEWNLGQKKAEKIIARKVKTIEKDVIGEREKMPAFRVCVRSLMKHGIYEGESEKFERWPPGDFGGFWSRLSDMLFSSSYGTNSPLRDFEVIWMMELSFSGMTLLKSGGGEFTFSKAQVKKVMAEEWEKEKQGVQTLF